MHAIRKNEHWLTPYHKNQHLFSPLTDFYLNSKGEIPYFHPVEGKDMPEPARYLLVHDSDMTGRLQNFYHDEIQIQVLHKKKENDVYQREVILVLNGDKKPVEFGAIRIFLHEFDEEPQRTILAGVKPLGAILNDYQMEYECQPSVFFEVEPDEKITEALSIDGTVNLYGRCNTLTKPSGEILAEVVEILPPYEDKKT